jgi:hypothetical protein
MKLKLILSIILVCLFSYLSIAKETKTSQYIIADDLTDFVSHPYQNLISQQDLLLWTIPTLTLFIFDEEITNYYLTDLFPGWKQTAADIPLLAQNRDNLMFESVKALFFWENLYPNTELKKFVYSAGEAMIDSFFVSQSLKHVFGRARPVLANEGPHSWGNLAFDTGGPYTAFPSTHATVYFAFSTILGKSLHNETLGDFLGALNFFVLNGNHNHWMSDMWIGYLLGKSIGNYVWEKKSNQDLSDQWFVYPSFYPGEGNTFPVLCFWKMF